MNLRNSIILSIVMGGLALEGSAFSIDLPGAQGTPVSAEYTSPADYSGRLQQVVVTLQ